MDLLGPAISKHNNASFSTDLDFIANQSISGVSATIPQFSKNNPEVLNTTKKIHNTKGKNQFFQSSSTFSPQPINTKVTQEMNNKSSLGSLQEFGNTQKILKFGHGMGQLTSQNNESQANNHPLINHHSFTENAAQKVNQVTTKQSQQLNVNNSNAELHFTSHTSENASSTDSFQRTVKGKTSSATPNSSAINLRSTNVHKPTAEQQLQSSSNANSNREICTFVLSSFNYTYNGKVNGKKICTSVRLHSHQSPNFIDRPTHAINLNNFGQSSGNFEHPNTFNSREVHSQMNNNSAEIFEQFDSPISQAKAMNFESSRFRTIRSLNRQILSDTGKLNYQLRIPLEGTSDHLYIHNFNASNKSENQNYIIGYSIRYILFKCYTKTIKISLLIL